jgi:Ca2+-binding RTX toxin-like protein
VRQRKVGIRVAATAVAAVVAAVGLTAGATVAATVIGDSGDNVLTGTERGDHIRARGGDDTVTALGGSDHVRAGQGNDTVDGGDGWDLLRGGRGDDTQSGGRGADLIFAGPGADRTDGGNGPDTLWALARKDVVAIGDTSGDELTGGRGRDRFRVRDGEVDMVHCGDGRDRVVADQFDAVDDDCERVKRGEITSLDQVDDRAETRLED